MKSVDRELVFWGKGSICKDLLEFYPNCVPSFYIDKYNNKEPNVVKPEEIKDWKKIFVVVTCAFWDDIFNELKTMGLEENVDFQNYLDYFNISQMSFRKSINSVIRRNKYESSVLITGPLFDHRRGYHLIRFFENLQKFNKEKKFVGLCRLKKTTEEAATELIGFPIIKLPEKCFWNGFNELAFDRGVSDNDDLDIELTEEEIYRVISLERERTSSDFEKSLSNSLNIYKYYKRLLKILRPEYIGIWSDIERSYALLKVYADIYNVRYNIFEFGYIPGTIAVDSYGVGGRSECAINGKWFDNRSLMYCGKDIDKIKKIIMEKELDSFKDSFTSDADCVELKKLDLTRKTVFFVGIGEGDMGPGSNPKSEFWRNRISNLFESSIDALNCINVFCKKYNYNLIYKPHPWTSRFHKDILIDDKIVYVKDISVDYLIKISNVVVTFHSAVDYKALMYNRAILQIGESTLNYAGCTYKPKTIGDLEKLLVKAINHENMEEHRKNFDLHMNYLLSNLLWDDMSDRNIRYGLNEYDSFFQ